MIYALLAVLVLFCSVVGYGVSVNGGGVSGIVLFTLAAVFVMQFAFVVGLFHH